MSSSYGETCGQLTDWGNVGQVFERVASMDEQAPADAKRAWLSCFIGLDVGPFLAMAGRTEQDPVKTWLQANQAARKRMLTALARVVLPPESTRGDASDPVAAQYRLKAAREAINGALRAKNFDAATRLLQDAQRDVKTIMDQPDAAMAEPKPGPHPDQVLFGRDPTRSARSQKKELRHPRLDDVHQNGVGDCYLLSTLASIAKLKPAVIEQMIKNNHKGTYTVRFYKDTSASSSLSHVLFGGAPLDPKYEPVYVTVDSNFGTNTANSEAGQGRGETKDGTRHEIWVQVVEKAYAKLMGGYDDINKDNNAMTVMPKITGKEAFQNPYILSKLPFLGRAFSLEAMQGTLAAGKPVLLGTMKIPGRDDIPGTDLLAGHEYVLDRIEADEHGQPVAILKNPDGKHHPKPIPFAKLGEYMDAVESGELP